MKNVLVIGAVMVALAGAGIAPTRVSAQAADKPMSLGTVHLLKKVMANGQPLAAGTYQVRLTSEQPAAAVGESPDSERFVEFLRGGKVVGREVATVVSNSDIGTIAKGKKPSPGTAAVTMLKGEDYLRVWINHSGTNYIIHLPVSA